MKMSTLFAKLRKKNRKEYRQFLFCMWLSVFLVTSYLMMYGSELVQNTLPSGGDSRKIADLIFGIAALGCIMFSIYASNLFLRFKSRETGVLLALGAGKKKLALALVSEVCKMLFLAFGLGILTGSGFAAVLGRLFERIASQGNDNHFTFSIFGVAGGIGYCLILFVCVGVLCVRFMRRTNVMDIINEQRKQEPLKKMVTRRYFIAGIVMIAAGIGGGVILPAVSGRIFKHIMGAWTNLFYVPAAVGLYRVLVYSIAVHKRGKNPQKYYNHMISYGMAKFQGASMVRNMLVITLLIMGGLLGVFYETLQMSDHYDGYEADVSLRYPLDAEELGKADILALAQKHGVTPEDYREGEFIRVLGDGVDRDDLDDKGNLIEEYCEKRFYYECTSASVYSQLTGKEIGIESGHYRIIAASGMKESIFNKLGEMSRLYPADGSGFIPLQYDGTDTYQSLVLGTGFDNGTRFIVSDEDYQRLKAGIGEEHIVRQILFDIRESGGAYTFSQELYSEFCSRASESMNHIEAYDEYQAELAGEDYGYEMPAVYDGERPALETDWQYAPVIIPLLKNNQTMSRAVFYLLFLYIAVICLAAESIIVYTRSQNTAFRNRQVFSDLEKLGADSRYRRRLLGNQVSQIFVLPSVLGCVLMLLYELLILWQNDGVFEPSEVGKIGIMLIAVAVLGVYQFLLYRFSLKKAVDFLEI